MVQLPGLGKVRPFATLSEKRITKATRDALRDRYGVNGVEVSCSAKMRDKQWWGECEIDGISYSYRIST